jgi:hypothetical protein
MYLDIFKNYFFVSYFWPALKRMQAVVELGFTLACGVNAVNAENKGGWELSTPSRSGGHIKNNGFGKNLTKVT